MHMYTLWVSSFFALFTSACVVSALYNVAQVSLTMHLQQDLEIDPRVGGGTK